MKESVIRKLEGLLERNEEVLALLSDADVIADQDRFRALSREYAQLEDVVKGFKAYQQAQADLQTAQEMLAEEDPELKEMAQEEIKAARAQLEQLEGELQILLLPKDPNDASNAFLEIRAGAGGDEAAIFAGDLFRMYSRYAESQRWQVEVMSASEGEHGGFKEVIAKVSGDGVYGKLKFESGGHRVQRVPETESQGGCIPRPVPWPLCTKCPRPRRWKSTRPSCVSTPSALPVPVVSTLTKPTRRFVLPTCPQAWWWNARISARSTRTRLRP